MFNPLNIDILIIGSGLSGAVIANKFANSNKKVLILEKRNHIAGNVFDKKIKGITTHMYGPHIFHTNSKKVFEYMNNFWELNDFKNVVSGNILEKNTPIPFNFESIDTYFPNESENIKKELLKLFKKDSRVSIYELKKQKNKLIKKLADFVYENIFENYTTKMWGKTPDQIDQSVLKRVPITIGYGKRYFSDKYEGIPKDGYTSAIKKMITHENIEIKLKVDASKLIQFKDKKVYFKNIEITCPIIYTGPLDELFNYKNDVLPYRSLDIKFKKLNQEKFQQTAVVNYPWHPTMTRITEYKHMTFEKSKKTILSKEYPGQYRVNDKRFGIPYYPMANDESRKKYEWYLKQVKPFKNFYPLGRLANYKYLNMDQIIENALDLSNNLLK